MSIYTVRKSNDPKRPGWVVVSGEIANPPFRPIQLVINDMVLPTEKEASAYCDRLNKLFGNKGE